MNSKNKPSPLVSPASRMKPRRKPLGALPVQSDKDLEDLATITPADLVRAQEIWRQDAPVAFKTLLQAQVQE